MTPRPRWREWLRDGALLFFAALSCYLLGALLAARLAPAASALAGGRSPVLGLLIGVLIFDLGRAPALLGGAWLLARALACRPWVAAAALTLITYAFDLLMAAALHQAKWLFAPIAVLACRGAAALAITWAGATLIKRRRAT